jgi:hypothetical protein
MIHCWQEYLLMDDHFWLTEAQLDQMKPHFPLLQSLPCVDINRVMPGKEILSMSGALVAGHIQHLICGRAIGTGWPNN